MSLSTVVWLQFATQYLGDGSAPLFGGQWGGSAMEALDAALVNVYSMLIATIPLIQHVAMQIFGVRTPIFGEQVWGR